MALTLLAAMASVFYGADASIDRDQLIRLIEAARPDFQDVSFEYEGEYVYPREEQWKPQGLGPDGIAETYSGIYSRRRDDVRIAEIYRFRRKTNTASRGVIAIKGDTVESAAKSDDSPKAQVNIRRAQTEEFGPGNVGSIWLRDAVLAYARSTDLYDYVGLRKHDGVDCLVVRFRLTEKEEDQKAIEDRQGIIVSKTFWIDLARNAHVLRCEDRWGDDLVKLMTGVRLESFEVAPGKSAWLPVVGHVEGRFTLAPDKKTRLFLDEPVYLENYRLLTNSVRWNRGLKDESFLVKAKPGDVVTDALRQAKYEYGQSMQRSKAEKAKEPSDEEVAKNLDRMLQDADVLSRELKASSPAREGTSWFAILPWGVAGLAAVGLVALAVGRLSGR